MKPLRRVSKKTGEVSYQFRVNVDFKDGQQIIKSMTWKPDKGMTPKQLNKELIRQQVLFEERAKQDYAEQLRLEAEEREEKQNIGDHITFKELAEKWLDLQESSKEYKASTIIKLKGCRERTYNAIGDVLVCKLDFLTVQEFITFLSKDGVNQQTGKGLGIKSQKSYLIFISDVMKYAKLCGFIQHNPCKDITFTKTARKDMKVYSLEETKQLLAAINEKAPTEYKLLFNLLAYSGMRKGEALGLEYKDIDFDRSVLSIRRTSNYHQGFGTYTDTPKTKSSIRDLQIAPSLVKMIQELHAEQKELAKQCGDQWIDSDRLFVNWCGEPLHPNIPYKWLQRFCETENIPFKGLHSFRHFTATQALANGIDVKKVSDMLGHSQTSTTMNTYIHSVQKANEDACNCIANLLEAS